VDAEILVNQPAACVEVVDRFQGTGADEAQMIENFFSGAAHRFILGLRASGGHQNLA
jgi:hypothetical protein